MVPTFTCGLFRSNFFFAIARLLLVSPPRGSNPRPRPYQGRALPTELGGQSPPFVLFDLSSPDTKRELLGATPSSRWVMKIIRLSPEKGKKRPQSALP